MSSTLIELEAGVAYRGIELASAVTDPLPSHDASRIDLLVINGEKTSGSSSGDARRAMEQLASHYAEAPIRVATLTPSGRPIALLSGELANVRVSATHAGEMIVAACRADCDGGLGIGVDLVDPASAGRGLDWWDDRRESDPRTNAERALLWGAREAAYKAASVDVPFAPAKIAVTMNSHDRFGWRTEISGGSVGGVGRFFRVAHFLLAVAVEGQWVNTRQVDQETTLCS